MRKSLIVVSASILLFGCGRPNHLAEVRLSAPPPPSPAFVPPPDIVANNSNGNFSYAHALALLMPHASVETRYDRARERCLHDTSLNCKLVSSSLDKENSGTYSAQLIIAVPHEKVGNHIADARVVIDHQNACAAAFAFHILFHSAPMSGPSHLPIAGL